MVDQQFALGMKAVASYFAGQRAEAEAFWQEQRRALGHSLKRDWLSYLERHDPEQVEEDFIEAYRSRVLAIVSPESAEAFLEWVEERVKEDEPLVVAGARTRGPSKRDLILKRIHGEPPW